MKTYLLLAASVVIAFGYSHPPLDTVPNMDLDRYMGKWHQVAAIPASFQRKCVSNSTAEYQRLDETHVQVINSCEQRNGERKISMGQARVNCDYDVPSRLQVTFAKFLNWWVWTFSGDYWVIELGEDYQYSVVGEESREYLWILSRDTEMSVEQLQDLEERIFNHGYDTCRVVITQEGELKDTLLCELGPDSDEPSPKPEDPENI